MTDSVTADAVPSTPAEEELDLSAYPPVMGGKTQNGSKSSGQPETVFDDMLKTAPTKQAKATKSPDATKKTDAPTDAEETDEAKDAAKEVAKERRRFKVPFKGKEQEFDPETDFEQIQRLLSKNLGAEKRFEEAAKAEKEKEEIITFLKSARTNFKELKQLYGEDEYKQHIINEANELLRAEIEAERLPPEARELQRRATAAETELQRYRQWEVQQKQQAQEAQLRQQVEAARAEIDGVAGAALAALKLPDDNIALKGAVGRKLIPYLQANLEREQPLEPHLIAQDYLEDTKAEFASIAKEMKGAALVEWLGKDVVNEIRRYDLGLHDTGTSEPRRNTPPRQVSQPRKEEERGSRLDPIDLKIRQRLLSGG